MKKITRRKLLHSGAMLGAAATAYSPLSEAALFVPTTRSSKKAVVIGSGFGGSVATLRLAEAGIPVALVERGRHWPFRGEGSFPTMDGVGGGGVFWMDPRLGLPGATGMLQEYLGGSIPVGCGACLGGGSMVYGGVLLQPRREAFEQALPYLSYDDMDSKYYPRVLSRVSGGPIPDDILNSPNYTSMRVFIENASKAGMEVVRSEVGFDWNIIRQEIQGKITPYASVGEWVLSCNSGAKKTLDRNYLVDANATGNVDIHTLHNVSTIVRRRFGGIFDVHCDVLNEAGAIIGRHIISCKYLFMAAGSIHTTRLLLKARALGDMPTVNDGVGENWGTNGDELMARKGVSAPLGPIQGGPPAIAAFDRENPIKFTGFMHSPTPGNGDTTQLQMGMCVPDQLSTATYNPLTDRVNFHWSRSANSPSHQALLSSMEKMTAVGGGSVVDQSAMGTWHPVGGAVMNVACSELGELYGTPNLFVVDGALIPGSTGAANPSLTIGANAERVMEGLIPTLS